MGFFDRWADKLERGNTDAVYEAGLQQLDAQIAEQTSNLASLRTRDRLEGEAAGYGALIAEAEQVLVELRERRRALDQERIAGPASKVLAESRVDTHDDETGLGPSARSAALSSVRDDIDALNRRAHPGYLDADGIPIKGRQAAMDRRVREDKAREELARLKRELLGDADAEE